MAREIVDVHGHWLPPSLVDASGATSSTPAVAASLPLLTDLDRQLELAGRAGTDVKVVCAPLSTLVPLSPLPAAELPARCNDALAEAVAAHDGRLLGLATVDAFGGDAAADEARRAIDELGLSGLVLDAARDDLLLSDPQARPVLELAAQRGVLVFAHPVNPPQIAERFRRGGAGILLARGTESALSTLTLLSSGTLDELPGLQLLIAGIGAGALLLSAFLDEADADDRAPSAARTRLHVDTMGFDPAVTRALVGILGPERVLVGSDWPIMWRDASAARVGEMLDAAGLDDAAAALVAGGNARRLLA